MIFLEPGFYLDAKQQNKLKKEMFVKTLEQIHIKSTGVKITFRGPLITFTHLVCCFQGLNRRAWLGTLQAAVFFVHKYLASQHFPLDHSTQ